MFDRNLWERATYGNKIKVKKFHPEAKLPEKAKRGDMGYDVFSIEDVELWAGEVKIIKTGIAIEPPYGWGFFVKDRSSMAVKNELFTHAGVMDNGYRGEYGIVMYNGGDEKFSIERGTKIAQLVPIQIPDFEIVEVDELNETERGAGGFGSTGK